MNSSHQKSPIALALQVSFPVFLSYFPLGLVFGVLYMKLQLPWYGGLLASVFAYSGAVQFVVLDLIRQHASYLFIFLSVIFIAARNSFYGLSVLSRYDFKPVRKCLAIFMLTDANYALMMRHPPMESKKDDRLFTFFLGFFIYMYWVMGTFVGVLLGDHIVGMSEFEFVLPAFFSVILLEYLRKERSFEPIIFAALAFLIAVFLVPTSFLLLTSILISCASMFLYSVFKLRRV